MLIKYCNFKIKCCKRNAYKTNRSKNDSDKNKTLFLLYCLWLSQSTMYQNKVPTMTSFFKLLLLFDQLFSCESGARKDVKGKNSEKMGITALYIYET